MSTAMFEASGGDQGADRKASPWVALAFWAGLITIPLSYLMAAHFVSLPVAGKAITLCGSGTTGYWRALHVLSESCGCSRSVMDYLIQRGANAEVVETVVLVDGSAAARRTLEKSGFLVVLAEADTLAEQYGSESVPYFQITDSEGGLWYSGAYQDIRNRSSGRYLDLETLALSQKGVRSENLPVLDCATSEPAPSKEEELSWN